MNRLFYKLLLDLKYFKHRFTLPIISRHDDVYLVEFPKSGVTWLRFLIGNTNLQIANINRQITLYNVGQYIPDIHVTRDLTKDVFDPNGFRFIKSHSEHNPFYNQVVYLIRQPWDVMNSYYNYMKFFGYKKSYDEFIRDRDLGIDAWIYHVESWLMRKNSEQRIHLVRYEDLKKDTKKVLQKIYQNLGMSITESILQRSINLSSFENMKESESFYRQHNPNYSVEFVRSGQSTKVKENEVNHYILKKVAHLEKFFLNVNGDI